MGAGTVFLAALCNGGHTLSRKQGSRLTEGVGEKNFTPRVRQGPPP